MMITLKLYAGLQKYLPKTVSGSSMQLSIDNGTSPEQILTLLNIPTQTVHLLMINGVYIAPEARDQVVLTENDVLAVWPAVAGG